MSTCCGHSQTLSRLDGEKRYFLLRLDGYKRYFGLLPHTNGMNGKFQKTEDGLKNAKILNILGTLPHANTLELYYC